MLLIKYSNYQTKSVKYIRRCSNIKLQYISDIHLEYRNGIVMIPKCGDYLAILGDIGNPFKKNYNDFLKYVSGGWKEVFIISGNHEYWNQVYNIDQVDDKIGELTGKYNNVHYLNNNCREIGDYTVLGTTLWSRIKNQPNVPMGDNSYIKNNAIDMGNLHEQSVLWLSEQISNTKKPLIVLTHHLPSYRLIVGRFREGRYAKYNDRFASNLDHLIRNPVKFWLCGHSHITIDLNINGVFCGINALGHIKHFEDDMESIKKFVILE